MPTLYPKAHTFRVPRDYRGPEHWVVRTESHDFNTQTTATTATQCNETSNWSEQFHRLSWLDLCEVLWTPPVRRQCCLVTCTEHTFCKKKTHFFFPVKTVCLGRIPFNSFLWQIQNTMFTWLLKCLPGSNVLYLPHQNVSLTRAMFATVTLVPRTVGRTEEESINVC